MEILVPVLVTVLTKRAAGKRDAAGGTGAGAGTPDSAEVERQPGSGTLGGLLDGDPDKR
jgi:hypothetical protein